MKTLKSILFFFTAALAVSCSKSDGPAPEPVNPNPASGITISGISPDYGKAGAEITVNGTGFSATASANTVTVGGKAAVVTSATTTQLKITAPADATHGTVNVKVGDATVTGPTFFYEPEVSSLSVTSGKAGDAVTVTGKNFGTVAADFEVKFNGVTAEITTATATTLVVKVPATATTGIVTVARKNKTAVNGPSFTIGTAQTASIFATTEGSITYSSILKTGVYGSILCFTIDETNNIMYIGTTTSILKADLASGAVSVIVANSTFLPTGGAAQPSAMDVGPDGKLYLLADRTTVFGLPANTSNVFYINTSTNTATMIGTKFIGLNLGGSVGDNVPFMVTGNNEFVTMDGSIGQIVKYSSDLSVRTVIVSIPQGLDAFHHMLKTTSGIRIVASSIISGSYYYDYSGGTLSAKTTLPAALATDMLTIVRGGSSTYEIKTKAASDAGPTSQHALYTIGKLNAGQTDYEKKASFTIERYFDGGGVKIYSLIGVNNGHTYFYADKNGNMYVQVISYNNDGDAGIYKLTIN